MLTTFLILFIFSLLLLLRLLWPFASLLILSYLITSLAMPVYNYFCRYLSSTMASVVTCSLIVVLLFVPLIFFFGALYTEALQLVQATRGTNIASTVTSYIQHNPLFLRFESLLAGYGINLEMEEFSATLSDLGREIVKTIYAQASIWAGNIINFILQFLMMILIIFSLLIEQERLVTFLIHLSPLPNNHDRLLIRKFEKIAGAILVGNGICGVIQGVLGGIAFAILGLSAPLLWGCVMGILAFLPIVGIGAVLGPAAIVLIIQGHFAQGMGLAIFYILLSMLVEYLLKPKLVGSHVQMHTVLVFLAILGGLSVFGVLGIIYGPLIVTAFLTLAEIYIDNYERYVTGEVETGD
ncbi:MAG: AI-2E family transporter [Thermodesulfobacteriota bacterium]